MSCSNPPEPKLKRLPKLAFSSVQKVEEEAEVNISVIGCWCRPNIGLATEHLSYIGSSEPRKAKLERLTLDPETDFTSIWSANIE